MSLGKTGFSLAEILIVIGITAAVTAISLVGLKTVNGEVKQTRADDMARTLYIAAQNRLDDIETVKDPWGEKMLRIPSDFDYWASKSTEDDGIKEAYIFDENKGTMYVADKNDGMLYDAVLANEPVVGGTFFIEYNAKTKAVYAAIYIYGKTDVGYREVFELLEAGGRENENISGIEAKNNRKKALTGKEDLFIGYYGGGILENIEKEVIEPAVIKTVNSEDLVLIIENNNPRSLRTGIEINISGVRSAGKAAFYIDREKNLLVSEKRSYSLDLAESSKNDSSYKTESFEDSERIFIVLDSLVPFYGKASGKTENRHFKSMLGDGFIPGEDLKVEVKVYAAGDFLAGSKTSEVFVNSLFESADEDNICISSIRHLENLDEEISGFEPETDQKVYITRDIYYSGDDRGGRNYLSCAAITGHETIFYEDDGAAGFVPVRNEKITRVYGNGHKIYDLLITSGEPGAGLFGKLLDCEISELGLVSSLSAEKKTEMLPLIKCGERTKYVGAFVGEARSVGFYRCFSTCRIDSEGECAGGFAGIVEGNLSLERSYGGGRVEKDGVYSDGAPNIALKAKPSSTVCAGGFAGEVCGDFSVTESYSTQSVGAYALTDEIYGLYAGGFCGRLCGGGASVLSDEKSYFAAPLLFVTDTDGRGKYNEKVFFCGLFGDCANGTEQASLFLDYFADWCDAGSENEWGKRISLMDLKKRKGAKDTQSMPYCGLLKENGYPFPDVTGLGHHYGDWQSDAANIKLHFEKGHGISEIIYGESICNYYEPLILPGDLSKVSTGYEGVLLSLTKSGGGRLDNNVFTAGRRDAVITVSAAALQPPVINRFGEGDYVYDRDAPKVGVCNVRKYDENSGIYIVYEFSEKESSDGPVFLSETKKISLGSSSGAVCSHTVEKDAYLGTRYYCISAYVSDGHLTSKSVSTGYFAVGLKRTPVILNENNTGRAPFDGEVIGNKCIYVQYGSSKLFAGESGEEEASFFAVRSCHELNGWRDEAGKTVLTKDGTVAEEHGVFKPESLSPIMLKADWKFERKKITFISGEGWFY